MKVMGYPTPLPYGVDPEKAAHIFLESYEKEAKIEFAFQICQCLALGLVRLSVICFCRRIFIVYRGSPMDLATKTLIAMNICWTLAFLLLQIFVCKLELWLHWSPLQDELVLRDCGDLRKPILAAVISDFALEVMALLLPLPSIWRLQVSAARRLEITGVFLLGLMSVIGSLIKLVYFTIVLSKPYDAGYDVNQMVTTMLWWGMLSASLAVIAACLPTVYALRKRMKWQFSQSSNHSWPRSWQKIISSGEEASSGKSDGKDPEMSREHVTLELQEVHFASNGNLMSRGEL
ncbi:hypothetical protein BDV95DRAFT_548747 [Massariosphaeria phaeospora]|uniref:Rhodopsin domain-containing protein n=1 Tax=Massariosphaeria phaeospora TaxID=100035 RepID=A0A7C8MGZ7_9PLEO|nr:hypothetical protein BDV95DRAFT_548747 [Massariosphaeria phaeospora]